MGFNSGFKGLIFGVSCVSGRLRRFCLVYIFGS